MIEISLSFLMPAEDASLRLLLPKKEESSNSVEIPPSPLLSSAFRLSPSLTAMSAASFFTWVHMQMHSPCFYKYFCVNVFASVFKHFNIYLLIENRK